jgi:hypothetical protein
MEFRGCGFFDALRLLRMTGDVGAAGFFCHSERSETESKNLRTIVDIRQPFGAKILRLAVLAQDDNLNRILVLTIYHRTLAARDFSGRETLRLKAILCVW